MIAKNPTPPPPHLFSLAQRRWKDSLVGLLHILPRLGKSGGHIPHSSPFSYSLRLSLFPPRFFLHLRVEAAVFCWRWGDAWDPRRGTFWRSGLSGRPVRTDASWSCGGRQWLTTMLSGIQDTAPSVHCELCALPRDMDLGNYLLACADFFLFLVFRF